MYLVLELLNRSKFRLNFFRVIFFLSSWFFFLDSLSSFLDLFVFPPDISLHFSEPQSSQHKANPGMLHKVLTWRALLLLNRDHTLDHIIKLIRKLLRNSFNLSELNFVSKLYLIGCLEWGSQTNNLVENAPSWPNVGFVVVWLLRDLLRGHVVRSTNVCVRKLRLVAHYSW